MEHQDKTNEQRTIRVLMSGGGTGGHIFPAVAIANEIKSRFPNAEFLFVGANGKMEMEKVPQAGFRIEGLNIAGFDRGNLLKNIGLPSFSFVIPSPERYPNDIRLPQSTLPFNEFV